MNRSGNRMEFLMEMPLIGDIISLMIIMLFFVLFMLFLFKLVLFKRRKYKTCFFVFVQKTNKDLIISSREFKSKVWLKGIEG